MKAGVSVILCCYNSEKRLPETIKHLAQQKVSSLIDWEVIVINNASTDNTSQVAYEEWHTYETNVPFIVVNESMAGLSYAKRTGIETADYDFCLFCDDDNWLSENYISLVYEIMVANPLVGILGGLGEEVCEITPPYWFDKFKGAYAVGAGNSTSGDISEKRGQVYGAGMVMRKSGFQELLKCGYKSILTGRRGETLSSGEDTEICYAFRLAGFQIWFNENLTFKHFLPAKRLNKGYLTKLFYSFGDSYLEVFPYDYAIKENHRVINGKFIWLRESFNFFLKFLQSPINIALIFKINSLDVRHYYAIFYLKAIIKLIKYNNRYDKFIRELYIVKMCINERRS